MYWPEEIRCAIFDLDGTILDSMDVWKEIDKEFLCRRKIEFSLDYTEAMKKLTYLEGAQYTVRRYHLQETPEEIMEEWNEMARVAYRTRLRMKPGVESYLQELRRRGIKTALATVSSEELYCAALKANRVEQYFDLTADISRVNRGKEYPDLYEYVASRLEVEPEGCLVFEDTLHSLEGARAGGFRTCAVYDRASQGDWINLKEAADFALLSFEEGILPLEDSPSEGVRSGYNT